ncbi:undecaprenyl pyrophosphate synthetase [Legionella beliardensis]|uniref:Ditrans,polycis-undecaprenyl-diphosphate synthase ((2E,6E)-farnesyl-diphosphate specific) n=2 Tax=Legionella beliardensis TaxID=91822 RepID=A0A378HYS3_9GAMM|nr:undecaprenyl pyrophosphate synthetase [Legionella beliardensis]
MDGNGRWAEMRGLLRFEGHRAGVETVKTIVRCCLEHTIPVLSLFAFSSENWARPETEIEFLMQLFMQSLNHEVQELHEHGIRLRFTGLRDNLSSSLQEQMQQAEELTASNSRLIVNVVINYGGRWDIIYGIKQVVREVIAGNISVDAIDENVFSSYLNTHDLPEPDLFIRTSGEQRISNFFLWQLAYTELYFTQTYWPDFTAQEFEKALLSFRQRERRYGKTSQQLNEIEHV